MMLKIEVWNVSVVNRIMKPLLAKDLPSFLKRFGNFVDGEIRSIEITSPLDMKVIIAGQDQARGFDWITVELEFDSVSDAKLLDSSKLSLLDMSDGISLLNENAQFYFGVDSYNSASSIKNSICYIISSSIKYKEGNF